LRDMVYGRQMAGRLSALNAMGRHMTRRANQLRIFRSVCQVLFAKIFGFSEQANRFILPPSCPTEGRLEIVTDAGQDAVDADGALDEGA